MKKTLCPFPGCLAIVNTPGHYCFAHRAHQAEKDRKERENATKRWEAHHEKIDYSWIWHDPRWIKLRAAQLKKQPLCTRCSKKAERVDHIIPHRGNIDLAFSAGNLQSLCLTCSNIKSREDRNT